VSRMGTWVTIYIIVEMCVCMFFYSSFTQFMTQLTLLFSVLPFMSIH